jgi:hypothetical protein
VDRLTLYANGRFLLIEQEKSRLTHVAKSFAKGEQTTMDAPETRLEGSYSQRGNAVTFIFDNGDAAESTLQANNGLQFDQNVFEKVSDNTTLPNTQRIQSNMEDIAKGLKMVSAIGGTVLKAAKTVQESLQQPAQNASTSMGTPGSGAPSASSSMNRQQAPAAAPIQSSSSTPAAQEDVTNYCDQCGSPVRPDKKFCGKCGARLP